jgi:hypothetical protein
MSDSKIQTGIRINESKYELLKAAAEYLGINSIGELVELIIEDSFEGTSPFTSEQLSKIAEIRSARGFTDTIDTDDTIIFPTNFQDFYNIFMKGFWYPIDISEERLKRIKYVSAYIVMPYSCISHYAEVQSIELMPNSPKYRIVFKPNSIRELPRSLKSSSRKDAVRVRRYTQLKKLLEAVSISQL